MILNMLLKLKIFNIVLSAISIIVYTICTLFKNIIGMPKMALSVISTPIRVFKEIDEIKQDCIWNSKTSKLSKATLTQSINNWGLKMCNFKLKTSALQLSWIKRLTNHTNDSWKVLPKYIYKCEDLITYFNSNHPLLHNNKYTCFLSNNTSRVYEIFQTTTH